MRVLYLGCYAHGKHVAIVSAHVCKLFWLVQRLCARMPPKAKPRPAKGGQGGGRRPAGARNDAVVAWVAPQANRTELRVSPADVEAIREERPLDTMPLLVSRLPPFMAEGRHACPTAQNEVAEGFFGSSGSFSRAPQQLLADLFDISRKNLVATWRRLYCAGWLIDRLRRQSLAHGLLHARPSVELISQVDTAMFDETPLRIYMQQSLPSSAKTNMTASEDQEVSTRAAREAFVPMQMVPTAGERVTTKLLQTRSGFGFLVRMANEDGSHSYVVVKGAICVPCPDRCAPEQLCCRAGVGQCAG